MGEEIYKRGGQGDRHSCDQILNLRKCLPTNPKKTYWKGMGHGLTNYNDTKAFVGHPSRRKCTVCGRENSSSQGVGKVLYRYQRKACSLSSFLLQHRKCYLFSLKLNIYLVNLVLLKSKSYRPKNRPTNSFADRGRSSLEWAFLRVDFHISRPCLGSLGPFHLVKI